MSTICLAAQRSYTTGEAVWFSYRLPSLKKFAVIPFMGIGFVRLVMAGLYAGICATRRLNR